MDKIVYSFSNFDVEVLVDNAIRLDEYFLCYIKTTEDNRPNCTNKMFYWCLKDEYLKSNKISIKYILAGPCIEGVISPFNIDNKLFKYYSKDDFVYEIRASMNT